MPTLPTRPALPTRRPYRRTARLGAAAFAVVAAALVTVLNVFPPAPPHTGPDGAVPPAPLRIGYVPYWDQERGFEVVRQRPDLFDGVSPVWYSLEPDGEVVLADPEHTTVDPAMVDWMQARGIRVLPTVTSLRGGEWSPDLVSDMLHDRTAMRTHIRELVRSAVQNGYDGIDIDYESLRAQDREPFTTFLRQLGHALRAEGKLLTAAVHPKITEAGYDDRNLAQDYAAIGTAVDQVRLMSYDYSWETSDPGPVAPAGWVEDVVAYTVSQIPAEKVILGVVLLGYDWSQGRGSTVDHERAQELARAHGATVRRSADGTPWFRYEDPSGAAHEVWYEDAVSVRAKVDLVARYGLGGAFCWRLGGEDPEVWPVLREQW